MSGTTKPRRNLLDTLLGRDKEPDNVGKAMALLEAALDEKGVERKELDTSKTKGVMEKLVMDMAKVVGKLTDDAEAVNNVATEAAALAIGRLLEAAAGTPIEEEVEDLVEGEEESVETEVELMEDDEEELPEAVMELTEQVKNLADESNENIKAMNALIPAIVKMADVMDTLQPLAKETGKIDKLIARLDAIEKKQNMKPRAASSAKETLIENDELKREIKKGATEQKTVLGFPVTDN